MPITINTVDASKTKAPVIRTQQTSWPAQRSKGVATTYERALRGVAKEVGKLIKGYMDSDPLNPDTEASLSRALNAYAELIGPWALHIVNNVLRQVDNQDKYVWRQHTKNMAIALRKEINNVDIGDVYKQIMLENVKMIKSIPTQAAQRVHKLVHENMIQSKRSSDLANKIMETEHVTKTRATLIARTEVSKASVALTQARALHIGSEGYIWHTVGDMLVRESHKKMNGKFVKWSEPPTLDNLTGHAGCIPNCRCWPEPEIPGA
jgi:SPP1 gp7 family putative phage head morphogenesis protein